MTGQEQHIAWIAVDWGTSNMRAWAMAGDGAILHEAASDKGMNKLEPTGFEAALLDIAESWLSTDSQIPVIVCGMAGARQGWIDAGYESVPSLPQSPSPLTEAPCNDARINAYILHGLCQRSPADVMRGEETQIAGLLAEEPDFDGMVCLPGTHSKWAWIRDEKVMSFTTFMTGEIFDLLSHQSVLRHSVQEQAWDEDAFRDAVLWSQDNAEALTARLFSVRANGLVGSSSPGTAKATLSGLLIGSELANIGGGEVAIIGDSTLASLYQRALGYCDITAECHDATHLTISGLTAAWHNLTEAKEDQNAS